MTRAPRQIGDKIVIVAVDGTTSPKKYELVPARNNYSYATESDQPEVEPNQPLAVPIDFSGGLAYYSYDPRTAGAMLSEGLLVNERGFIRAAPAITTVTLTGAANPPNYFFETTVNDGGADDGQPVLYVIANEAAEVNVYKISLDSGDFGTLLNTKTFSVTPTQPCGQPAEWNDGSNTKWYLGLGDSTNRIQRLTTIVSSTSDDTWTPSSDADARQLKVVGNRLMRSTNENQVSLLPRAGNPLTEASWGSDFFVGDVSRNITELGEAGGLAYIAKEDGFYEWDTVGQATNIFPEIGKATRNGQGMKYWHGGFGIPAASGLWWTRTGEPIGPDSNPENRGVHPSFSIGFLKHGHWHGSAPFGANLYGYYTPPASIFAHIIWMRERDAIDPSGWGPIISHTAALGTGDLDDFHGMHITELSENTSTIIKPALWFADGNNVSFIFLDNDGKPLIEQGATDINSNEVNIFSGDITFGFPKVLKQLRVIEGWAENLNTNHSFQFAVFRDGGAGASDVGAAITTDGFFQRFWTQDSNDTARALVLQCGFTATSNTTDQNGPYLRDVSLRAVALPNTAQIWTFNFYVRDDMVRTAKGLRSELEGYLQDLKQYELPDGDTINGVMTAIRLLRADEIHELFSDMQPPPKYVLQAQVRQMVSA